MPVRTRRALNTSVFQHNPSAKPCQTSRRQLHASFWSHGGNNLSLPLWWDAILAPMSQVFLETSKAVQSKASRRVPRSSSMLDFLYPRNTMALLETWSHERLQRFSTRAISNRGRPRCYSSIPSEPPTSSASVKIRKFATDTERGTFQDDALTLRKHLEELDWIDVRAHDGSINTTDKNKARFVDIVRGTIPDRGDSGVDFDRAWEAYNDLHSQYQTVDAKIMLANYLSFSDRETDSIRLLFLTSDETFEAEFAVWRAIAIRLFDGDLSKAAEIHDAAQQQNIRSYIGSDLLLAHAIQAEDWKLAVRISTIIFNSLQKPYDRSAVRKSVHKLWTITTRLGNLRELLSGFLAFAYERLDLQYFVIKAFISHFLLATLSRIPQTTEGLKDFLEEVQQYRIDEKPLLQFSLERIVAKLENAMSRIKLDYELFKYVETIWAAYRRFCGPGDIETPIMHGWLNILTRPANLRAIPAEEVQTLVLEILSTCSTRNIPMPYATMVSVLRMYAIRGNVEMVRFINTTLIPHFGQMSRMKRTPEQARADRDRGYALMLVHAERNEAEEAEEVFARLISVHPRVKKWQALWQVLIRVYAKQNRYSKVFDILFRRMADAGSPPQASVFRYVLGELGHHGSVAVVTRLLDIAKRNGIVLDSHMIDSLVSAHIAKGDHVAAEELLAMIKDYRAEDSSADSYLSMDKMFAASRENDLVVAASIYRQMMESPQIPHRLLFVRMVDIYTRNNRTDKAFKIAFEDMPLKGLRPDTNIYGLLIRGYWHEMRYKEAIRLFDSIPRAEGLPNVTCCQYWLGSLVQLSRSRPRMDKEVLAGLRALIDGEFKHAAFVRDWPPSWFRTSYDVYFASVIDRFSEVAAWDIVNYLQQWYIGLSPEEMPLAILKSLMKANAIAGNHDEVNRLFDQALSQLSRDIRTMADDLNSFTKVGSIEPPVTMDEATWMLSHDDGSGQTAQHSADSEVTSDGDQTEKTQAMTQVGTAHDLRHLAKFLVLDHFSSLVEQGQFDTIIEVMSRLQNLGFVLPEARRMWNHFVQCLCKSSEPRHIISAFRTAEMRLFSKHAIFQESGLETAEERRSLVIEKASSRRDEIRVEGRTMVMLKEVALAALRTSIDHIPFATESDVNLDNDDEATTVSLSSVLEQVAPRMFPAVMNWRGNEFINNRLENDYFLTPLQSLAAKTRKTRQLWWQRAQDSEIGARATAYGAPGELLPVSSFTKETKDVSVNESPAYDLITDVSPPIIASDMLEALQKAADNDAKQRPIEKASWEAALYETVEADEVKIENESDAPSVNLGFDKDLQELADRQQPATAHEAMKHTAPKQTNDDIKQLYAGLREKLALKKGDRHWARAEI